MVKRPIRGNDLGTGHGIDRRTIRRNKKGYHKCPRVGGVFSFCLAGPAPRTDAITGWIQDFQDIADYFHATLFFMEAGFYPCILRQPLRANTGNRGRTETGWMLIASGGLPHSTPILKPSAITINRISAMISQHPVKPVLGNGSIPARSNRRFPQKNPTGGQTEAQLVARADSVRDRVTIGHNKNDRRKPLLARIAGSLRQFGG